jgi:murein DD-endopeptidase MepM/ murein hydrolase activator NlpD
MGRTRFWRVAGAVAVALVVMMAPAYAVRAMPAAVPVWTRPVTGPVVRVFQAPRTPYGPGHRGVDFAASPGTAVVAAGAGRVVFAGWIGPSAHVVVRHPINGWRTGYSFLAALAVRSGDEVGAGTVVGIAGGLGDGHDGSVLHFSLRIGDEYVDPMILFRPLDLATAVHLAPMEADRAGTRIAVRGGLARAEERAALVAGLRSAAVAPPLAPRPVVRFGARPRLRRHALIRWRYF